MSTFFEVRHGTEGRGFEERLCGVFEKRRFGVLGTRTCLPRIWDYGMETGSENFFSRKWTFARWHLGQVHSSGRRSNGVPGSQPASRSPFSGSYL